MVSTPVTAHATRSHPGLPISRAMSADTMKIPDPIIEPTTTIVASKRFSPRVNSVSRATAGATSADSLGFAIGPPRELGCGADALYMGREPRDKARQRPQRIDGEAMDLSRENAWTLVAEYTQ